MIAQNEPQDAFAATFAQAPLSVPAVSLGSTLGRGAFGAVFRGTHQVLDIPVAVKIVEATAAAPGAIDLAMKEARLMARLDHPNLVRIFDAGRIPSGMYLVMELMDGGSFESVHHVPANDLLHITRQALSGLSALHDARIIHRDIKPANLLRRSSDGRVKLGDLGIALLQQTQAGPEQSAGTLPFMAPELWANPPRYSPQSDLYALGLTIACLALEADPFPTQNMALLLSWITSKERPNVGLLRKDIPGELSNLVSALLNIDASLRPISANAALSMLDNTTRPAEISTDQVTTMTVGAWNIGDIVWQSPNWENHAAYHRTTGAQARWAHACEGGATAKAYDMIARGGRLAMTFDHKGFLPVLDWGELEGRPWVVTAPLGQSLTELMKTGEPLDEPSALTFALDIAEALVYLHGRDLVYQAVAPGSVYIGQDARCVQLGWPWFVVPKGTNVAGADGRSGRAGIPQYLPPECFSASGTIEPTADIWGLGEILFLMLTGKTATQGEHTSLYALAASKLLNTPSVRQFNENITAPTVCLVESLFAREPGERPSANEAAHSIKRILGNLRYAPGPLHIRLGRATGRTTSLAQPKRRSRSSQPSAPSHLLSSEFYLQQAHTRGPVRASDR